MRLKPQYPMSTKEHGFLITQPGKHKKEKPNNIAEICLSCRGLCKASVGLIRCPGKEKFGR